MDERLDMTWQCTLAAQKVKHVPGCIQSSTGSRARKGFCPSGMLHPALRSPAKERHGPVGASLGEGHKNAQRAGAHLYEDVKKGLWLFSLEKKRFCGDRIVACPYLEWASNKDGDKYFSRAYCPRTRSNGFKLKSIDSDRT